MMWSTRSMFSKIVLCVAILFHALPTLGGIHERMINIPRGWKEVAPPDNSTIITLSIALRLENLHKLESQLAAVSDPKSSQYGQYLDAGAVDSMFAPSVHSVQKVVSWLNNFGINETENTGHFITFPVTVGEANSLLNTTFSTYEAASIAHIRTVQYSIPDSLSNSVDFISPTTFFGNTPAKVATYTRARRDAPLERAVDSSCQTNITPSCLKQLYNVGNYIALANSGSRIGFSSFPHQSALYSDLYEYERLFNIPSQNFSVVLINNATNNQSASLSQTFEANLDVQITVGVSHPLPVTEFITAGSAPFIPNVAAPTPVDNFNEPWLTYFSYLLSQPNSAIPQVISNSYNDDEQTVPEYYARRVCNMIGMLGLRGITVLENSGDSGVGSACLSNDGTNKRQFTPQFPGTCPYITTVGGTESIPETAWVASAGGFSNYFSQAWYQKDAVNWYFSNHISKDTKRYYQPFTNFNGRGFPDVAAYSSYDQYTIVYQRQPSTGGGTSASTPVVASLIALLNDARLRAGKKPLGFINPLLYSLQSGILNDITTGSSKGCTGTDLESGDALPGAGVIPYASWNATVGWDPVTGLGTVDFGRLLGFVIKLP